MSGKCLKCTKKSHDYEKGIFKIIKKMNCSDHFRKLHDDFLNSKNEHNYDLLVNFLDEMNNKLIKKFGNVVPNLTTLLTDNNNVIIYNSKATNTFDNYTKGTIMYNDIWQAKSISIAEQQNLGNVFNKEQIYENIFKYYYYFSSKVGSSYTVGGSNLSPVTSTGCILCDRGLGYQCC